MLLNGGISVNRRLVGLRENNGRWLSKSERNCGSIVSSQAIWIRLSNSLDTSLRQYGEISLMKRPKDSQVKSLREWIESPHLGGGCGFLGRDLGGFAQEAAYDPKHVGDLVMLSEELGEDDILTSFISGPLLRLFHAFRQRYKVREIFNSRSNALSY